MTVSWDKDYNPSQVIKKLEDSKKVKDGKVEFEGWGFKEAEILVYSMLNFPPHIPEVDARGIVSRAIFAAGAKGPITPRSVLREVNRLEREYQNLPIRRFILTTSISVDVFSKLPRIRLGSNLIIFEEALKERFRGSRQDLLHRYKDVLFAEPPTNYMTVRVHVSAKTVHDAANKALESVDFVRGIWNWSENRRYRMRMTWGGKQKPVNQIILGPLHTLHKPNGTPACDIVWYELSYLGAISPLRVDGGRRELFYKWLAFFRRKLKNHKYPEVIKESIIRYARALDERIFTTAFIKLWGVLELLTDTVGASYQTTVKRTSFIFEERDYHLQVLQHLRKYRNSSVHMDSGSSEIETYLYQIKNYVEALIEFHIGNKYGFSSIQDAASFLSLPHDDNALAERIKKLQFARKFLGYS